MKASSLSALFRKNSHRVVGLWLMVLLLGRPVAAAASSSIDPAEQPSSPCLQAKTALQCRDALAGCQQLAERFERDPDTPQAMQRKVGVLGQLFFCEKELGQYPGAAEHARRVLALQQKLHGPEGQKVATAMSDMAGVLSSQDKDAEAEPILRTALAMQQKLLGPEHPDIAASLNDLASVLSSLGRNEEAEALLSKALAMRKKLLGDEHVDVASSVNNLALMLSSQGKYGDAEPLLRKSLAMRQKLLGPEHPDVASSFNSLATVLDKMGKYGEAEPILRKALAMRQKLLGPEHPDVASSFNSLALVLDGLGKYGEAELILRKALAMRQKLLGPEARDVASSLHDLGGIFVRQGQYGEAESMYRQSLALMRKRLGVEHPDVAICLLDLADSLLRQGKYGEAELMTRQALSMMQKLLGPEHPYIAASFNNLADVLSKQSKYGEAEAMYRQALVMRQKLLGTEHLHVAVSLNDLAGVLEGQGNYGEAEAMYRHALAMVLRLLGADHPHVAGIINNLAFVLARQKKYGEAEAMFRQALAMMQSRLGPEHPTVADIYINLASLQMQSHYLQTAVPLLAHCALIRESQLRAAVSETRMNTLLETFRVEEDKTYSLILADLPTAPLKHLVLQTALLRKGRAAEAGAAANSLLHAGKSAPELGEMFARWQSLRQQREARLYAGPGALSPADYQSRLKELSLTADSLEYQLAAKLPGLRALHPPKPEVIVAEVANRLPQDGVLMEVLWVRPYQPWIKGASSPWGAPHYVALLLFPDQRIESQDLGEAAAVEEESHALLAALGSPQSNPMAAAGVLYQRLLAPLLPRLQRTKQLYLSLDGVLNLVPFDALHDGKDYLLGRYRLHYLTSGRDLLRQPATLPAQPPLLLANPDFGKAPPLQALDPDKPLFLYQRLRVLDPLPGTEREALLLSPLLGITPLLRKTATEERVRAARSPWILHIATHGIFLGDRELPRPADRGLRSASVLEPPRAVKNVGTITADNLTLPGSPFALSQSALILAGAAETQGTSTADKDGLLTAEEARSLDLNGTQLVVLSACQTGQGTLSAGQGVYGLRRAFLVAGAETLVSSLWRVSDDATGDLMQSYYRRLLDRKSPGDRVGAMQEAMSEMRRQPGRSHPYYWAPFVVVGQDGPLRRPPGQPALVP